MGSETPEVRYARSGDIEIAYSVVGDGPMDLVFVSGFISHLDLIWEIPAFAARHRHLAEFGRLICFDKRGTGLSDRTLGFGSVADRMDDIRAVMDAAGSQRAALYAVSEGGPLALVFAATYPDRVSKLALYGTFARALRAPDYPIGFEPDAVESIASIFHDNWGTGKVMKMFWSDAPDDAIPLLARYERSACTPQMADEIVRKNLEIDVRDVLPAINVPTMVVHTARDPLIPVEGARYMAEHIAGARYLELEGDVHAPWDWEWQMHPDLRQFLRGDAAVSEPGHDRVLATVLFTDIVKSTERAAAMGDRRWKEILDDHDRIARREMGRYRGRLIKTTGDGLLATFDGPARAIGCAQGIYEAMRHVGVDIRAGVHTGEIELREDDITGLGVVIARRICDSASDGELLASRTVKDLVAGSGISFSDRGDHQLKGVPDDWRLYAVQP
jgi:class 3 adenylate cyclase